jgi:hypothetical protein
MSLRRREFIAGLGAAASPARGARAATVSVELKCGNPHGYWCFERSGRPPLAVSTNRPTIERSDSGYRRTKMVPSRPRSSHDLGSINRRVPAGRRACGTVAAIGVRPQRGVGLGLAQLLR